MSTCLAERLRSIADVVKKEWGFDGVVMSDWKSTYDGVGAANAGLDLEMPSGVAMNRASLLPAVKSGVVSAATIDDKVRRILRMAARFGWLDREQADLAIPTLNPRGDAVALEAARQGMVLLKNEGQILPLDRTRLKTVAVIGPLAHPGVPVGGGSAGVQPYRTVSQLEGIAAALGPNVTVLHHRGLPTFAELANRTNFTTEQNGGRAGVVVEVFGNLALEGRPAATRVEERINLVGPYVPPGPSTDPKGAFSSARWTGWFTPTDSTPHRFFLFDFRGEAGCRAMVDGKPVLDNWEVPKAQLTETTMTFTPGPHKVVLECSRRVIPGLTGVFVRLGIVPEQSIVELAALAIAAKADVVVAALGYDAQVESESGDRPFALPGGQDLLIKGLVGANKRTIVAITSGGGVDMAGWLDSVPAVVMSWFSGQQGGTALGQLLTGDANFSGRLPITIEKSWADNPNHDSYYPAPGTKKVPYSNGVFVGYRGYERDKVAPLFPFGVRPLLHDVLVRQGRGDAEGRGDGTRLHRVVRRDEHRGTGRRGGCTGVRGSDPAEAAETAEGTQGVRASGAQARRSAAGDGRTRRTGVLGLGHLQPPMAGRRRGLPHPCRILDGRHTRRRDDHAEVERRLSIQRYEKARGAQLPVGDERLFRRGALGGAAGRSRRRSRARSPTATGSIACHWRAIRLRVEIAFRRS